MTAPNWQVWFVVVLQTIVLVVVAFTLFVRLQVAPSDVYHRLEVIDAKLESVILGTRDRWTRSDQKLWAERLQTDNPDLTVPK